MSSNLKEVEGKARELSQQDRARLALSLIQSLESQDDGDVSEAWRAEVESRWNDIERGDVTTTPATEAFSEVRRSLR